uniref:Reverse transcriptase domain-containing protein n=1 Tax=Coleochaete scutata TaxID=3125 RepID=A0A5P9NVZ4_COLSC|nr:hypothetical protein [Coleochaete scutata]QFU80130.1 hypothetical protein [Coleochaete scutata]
MLRDEAEFCQRTDLSNPSCAERSDSLAVIQSLARAKYYMKVGSAIVVFPQLQTLRGHEDGKTRNRLSSVDPLLLPHTGTNSIFTQGYVSPCFCNATLNAINRQSGNLVKTVEVNQFTPQSPEIQDLVSSEHLRCLETVLNLSSTLPLSKLRLDMRDWYGGKIAEKANALSNVKDRGATCAKEIETTSDCSSVKAPASSKMMRSPSELSDSSFRLIPLHRSLWPNSVLSMRATDFRKINIRCQRIHESSLATMKSETKLLWPTLTRLKKIADKVYAEQLKLVELAKKYGKDHPRILRLQETLALSLDFRTYSVHKVMRNSGASTPGIDGITLNTPEEKALMIEKLREILSSKEYKASPARRVFIAKPNGKKRPLGIPTIKDRCLQQIIKLVLEPLVEMNSDLHSYGFRKYRSAKNAIGAVRVALRKNMQEKHILDADIEGFFDNINHQWLIKNTPLPKKHKDLLSQWLKARSIYKEEWTETITGTPQGGIISPILANLTLDGLEKAVDDSLNRLTKNKERRIFRKRKDGTKFKIALKIKVVRFADDFIIIARSKHILKKYVLPTVKEFLLERGLTLSKTRIVNVQTDPLNLLGYTFRYRDKWKVGEKFYKSQIDNAGIAVFPQKDRLKTITTKLRTIIRSSLNLTAYQLIANINPIIRGWSNYFNLGNSARYRDHLRQALYRLCWKWAQNKHPRWGKKAIARTYFKSHIIFKNTTWVFHGTTLKPSRYLTQGRASGKKIYLVDPTNIVSSVCATKFNIPNALLNVHAFHKDHLKIVEFISKASLLSIGKHESYKAKLLKRQKGMCAACNKIIDIGETNIHHVVPISEGGSATKLTNMILIHPWCHKEIHFA